MNERIFDTHAHYFDRKFSELDGGAEAILDGKDFKSTVCGVVNVATNCDNAAACLEQVAKYDFMYAAVGIHPSDAQNDCKLTCDGEIARLRDVIGDGQSRKKNKIVAIGEIGLDYYWQPVNKPLQLEYFDKQMQLACEFDLPVIIHDREAHADTFDMIVKHPKVRGVLHSCSMSAEMVREIVKRGWYVSFSGPLTYKNAQKVRDACAAVPLDRLLVETDAPYLAPVPHRGKINNSVYMISTVEMAALIHSLSFDEMARLTAKNARDLFRI
ncbi:MAG: TatD family deoxyribonuclease [Ruminococcaceae bacterium]|nr:TatD family deoxyribonuclease [Oscillospiraceae bacterium]